METCSQVRIKKKVRCNEFRQSLNEVIEYKLVSAITCKMQNWTLNFLDTIGNLLAHKTKRYRDE